jgi:hypothetical protein
MPEQYPPNPNQPQQPNQQGMPPQWAAQQPGYGYPQGQPAPQHAQQPPQSPFPGQGPAPYQPPQAPKKKSPAGKIAGFGCLGVVALFVIIGIAVAAGGGSDDSSTTNDSSASAPEKPAPDAKDKPAAEPKKGLSQADQFKAFVAKNGTPAEKTAVKHVIKVQGADKNNDILDAADVYTDYAGGLMGPHQADGKLLASAFADWKHSENGLVTVYDKAGELLSNGNY